MQTRCPNNNVPLFLGPRNQFVIVEPGLFLPKTHACAAVGQLQATRKTKTKQNKTKTSVSSVLSERETKTRSGNKPQAQVRRAQDSERVVHKGETKIERRGSEETNKKERREEKRITESSKGSRTQPVH